MIPTEERVEGRIVRIAERPIDFETFLTLAKDRCADLIKGVMEERMAAQLDHEKLQMWMSHLLGGYVEQLDLGIVLGSRTPVQIDAHDGRMPDLLFVRKERLEIVQERAVYGAPDLVIEIISPNDRPSDIIGLETDYCSLGVMEILFIDRLKGRIRVLRRSADGSYTQEIISTGPLRLATLNNLTLQAKWILQEPRPTVFNILKELLSRSG